MTGGPRVLLVQMPFFRLDAPSAGLAILEASLKRAGLRADVEYLNLDLGVRIGADTYAWLAGRAPRQLLLGDLVFTPGLYDCAFDLDRVRALAARLAERRDEPVPPPVIDALPRVAAAASRLLDEAATRLRWQDYDLVGVSTFFNVVPALALARRAKESAASPPVVLGGCNCEGEMGEWLHRSFPFLDFVCRGEGEAIIVEIASRLGRGCGSMEGVPGLVWRDESGGTRCNPQREAPDGLLDELPFPSYDGWLARARARPAVAVEEIQLPIETSRGCSHGQARHCIFCGLNGGRIRFRSKSASRILREFEDVARHGVRIVHCVDNVLDRGLFAEVLPELARRGRACEVFWEVRPDFTRQEMALLARAGIVWLQAGIESLSTPVLRLMRKGTTAWQNVRFLRRAAEFGLGVSWSVLFGLPGEAPADYDAMAALMPSLSHLQPPRMFQRVRVDRFSPLFDERRGLSNVVPAAAYGAVFPFDAATVARLAYFFEHGYDPPRDPETWFAPCASAIERWRAEVGRAALVRFDTGTTLHVIDTRATSVVGRARLRGAEREVYLAAEEGGHLDEIAARTPVPPGEVERIVESLVERRFAVLVDGRVLPLAVPTDAWAPRGVPPALVADTLVEGYCRRIERLYRGYQAHGDEGAA